MKRVLVLHGTDGSSQVNWFPWLKQQLGDKGVEVWVPDLPQADKPNINRYAQFIFQNKNWVFDRDTVLIGHSSGAVAILGLLQKLPKGTTVGTCILVGAFKDDLGWEALSELFLEKFDFDLLQKKAAKFIFIHSDNDPYCPLDHAQYLAEKLAAQLIVKKGQGHFSTGKNPEYTTFPYLLELLEEVVL